jgi:hypothetical protein
VREKCENWYINGQVKAKTKNLKRLKLKKEVPNLSQKLPEVQCALFSALPFPYINRAFSRNFGPKNFISLIFLEEMAAEPSLGI